MDEVATTSLVIKDSLTGVPYEFRLVGGSLRLTPVGQGEDGDVRVASSWPPVSRLANGQLVEQSVLNRPIADLEERTNYLYDKLRAFDRNNPLAAVVVSDVGLASVDTPSIGDIVYIDPVSAACRKALATSEALDMFRSSASSDAVGMLVTKSGGKGSVALFGRIDMSSPLFDFSRMVEDGETFRDGVYYLSGRQAGRITATPTGPRVVVGQFFSRRSTDDSGPVPSFAYMHVESKDFSEAHYHASYGLSGAPAGDCTVEVEGQSKRNVYLGYLPDALQADDPDDPNPEFSGAIVPRLVFSGSWLSDDENIGYEFVLGGSQGADVELHHSESQDDDTETASVQRLLEFGQNPSVYLYWSREGASGEIEFTAFNQPKEMERGVYVELRRDASSSGDVVLDNAKDDLRLRTWHLSFPSAGRGWRDLSESEAATFGSGKVPSFVYNIGYDAGLRNAYPPVPASGASLVVDGVEAMRRSAGHGLYLVGLDSIYWYGDGAGCAPWLDDGTPRAMSLNLVRSVSTETGPVVSIRARDGSGIRVLRCGTNDTADVGDIELDFDPTGDAEDAGIAGYSVVKEGAGGKFLKGPVVERIIAGAGIRVGKWKDNPRGQGTVVLSAADSGMDGPFDEVVLQNAKQDLVGMFPYVRLLGWTTELGSTNTGSAFILKFHVRYDNPDAVYRVNFSGSVFGTSGYEGGQTRYAGIQVQYAVLPDYNPVVGGGTYESANIQDDLIVPDEARTVEIPLVSYTGSDGSVYRAFDPVFVHTEDDTPDSDGRRYAAFGAPVPSFDECAAYAARHTGLDEAGFGVRPGYTVSIRIARGPVVSDNTEYTGSIGFMNMAWSLERVTDA